MSRLWLSRLVALVLLATGFCIGLSTSAVAEPTVETLTAPEVEPAGAYAHGDGSVTITNNCFNHEWEETAAVTISSEGSVLSKIPRKEGEWEAQACFNSIVPGFDSTTYVAQTGSVEYHSYRVVAFRDNAKLWITSFVDPAGCGSRLGHVQSMAMGQDGNLYAAIYWNYKSGTCPEKDAIASIDPSTGAIRFTKVLPNTGSGVRGTNLNEVQPYENGVVVLNGNEVFYYNYEGEVESSKTFTAASGEATIIEFKIAPDTGRIYWYTQVYKPEIKEYEKTLYYRNLGGSSNEKIALPKGQWLVSIFPAPSNEVVAEWKEGEKGSTKGFDYINEESSVVYEKILTTETGASVQEAGLTAGTIVDDFGNVIVRRIMDENSGDHDRNVVVDSFSPAGIKTRLFNSSSLGTSKVVDSFTTISQLTQSMGKGHIYLNLCHVTGKITEGCSLTQNPVVISISDTSIGEYDYPRSAIFGAGLEKSSYVALGDSYSSGEGVPSFIPPSDTDGCHRSYAAYPVHLASELSPSLRLDAFVACSGAKTSDVELGMNGEASQLNSLNSDTNVVTITIGGNDAKFKSFVTECVNPLGSCDSTSSQYKESMEAIEVLPEKLEELYSEIRSHAENAEAYVVGYPQVAPEPGVSCKYLEDPEKEAAREVTTALDNAIKMAVEKSGKGFTYVDPNTEASPFFGHELCTTESYFLGFEILETEYSFHPNILGQYAYAILISEAL
jgi:hypothetical protein